MTIAREIALKVIGVLEAQGHLKNVKDMDSSLPIAERLVDDALRHEREVFDRFLCWWANLIHQKHHVRVNAIGAYERDWRFCKDDLCTSMLGSLSEYRNETPPSA